MSDDGAESCRLSTHAFTGVIVGQNVHFSVLRMTDSFYIWIGTQPNMDNLAMAIGTKFQRTPLSTSIVGDSSDQASCMIAQKLAARCKKQAYVSYNVPGGEHNVLAEVEKRILEEITCAPDKF